MTPGNLIRPATLLAINILHVIVWAFAGISKVRSGMPAWFPGKFGDTWLGRFPGVSATFWLLALSELLALALAAAALFRGEFLGRKNPAWLSLALVWSLFVFVQLGFGQWLTNEFVGAFQQFVYFGLTLQMLAFVAPASVGKSQL